MELIRGLYEYHRWANRRLFDVAAGLGDEVVERDLGTQWSVPTIRRMFVHLYGADAIWLARWRGTSPERVPGADIDSLAALRPRWDQVEEEQRQFVEALAPDDLARVVDYRNTEGKPYHLALGPLLQHVANHATHHRSEIATMITQVHGSPPPTDMSVYQLIKTGQMT